MSTVVSSIFTLSALAASATATPKSVYFMESTRTAGARTRAIDHSNICIRPSIDHMQPIVPPRAAETFPRGGGIGLAVVGPGFANKMYRYDSGNQSVTRVQVDG